MILVALALAADPDWIGALATSDVTAEQLEAVRALVAGNRMLGTGLPGPTRHAMTPEVCRERRGTLDVAPSTGCGRLHMVDLPDGEGCIDQFEFPGVPCAYPVIWVRASEAAALCEAVGKRLCDASEWEDACAGDVGPPEPFDALAGLSPEAAQKEQRRLHNASIETSWAYGPAYRTGICATGSAKNPACDGGSPALCGSNTYPTGAFPSCRGALEVYDLHGNAAEHMSLPIRPEQLHHANGLTEMKGSWFVFDTVRAHADHCRWRAPYWHGTPVRDVDSHRNYHLGFRCCTEGGGP